MKRKPFFLLLVLFILGAMALAACQPATAEPTTAPAAPTTAPAPAEPTEMPMPAWEPTSLVAPDCDYGGKIKSIKFHDLTAGTLVFHMHGTMLLGKIHNLFRIHSNFQQFFRT